MKHKGTTHINVLIYNYVTRDQYSQIFRTIDFKKEKRNNHQNAIDGFAWQVLYLQQQNFNKTRLLFMLN